MPIVLPLLGLRAPSEENFVLAAALCARDKDLLAVLSRRRGVFPNQASWFSIRVLPQRELWIRLSQIRHGYWPHLNFGLCKGVGGKTGEDMDQSIAGRSVSGVLQPHM